MCSKQSARSPILDEPFGFGTERSAPRSHLFSLPAFRSYGFLNHAVSLALLECEVVDLLGSALFDDELVDAELVDLLGSGFEDQAEALLSMGFIWLSPQARKQSCHAASSA